MDYWRHVVRPVPALQRSMSRTARRSAPARRSSQTRSRRSRRRRGSSRASPAPRRGRRGRPQMSHFRPQMSHRSLRPTPSSPLWARRGPPQMGRRRRGKGLVAIAQEDQQLGLQALQRLANPRQGLSAQRCHRRRGGGLQAERHQGGGMEPISVNLSHGAAMPLAEVAAAHDQLHGQVGICINRRDQMAQQAVFRPAAGEHGDAAHSRVLSHQSGHRPDSCVGPGGPTRADNTSG